MTMSFFEIEHRHRYERALLVIACWSGRSWRNSENAVRAYRAGIAVLGSRGRGPPLGVEREAIVEGGTDDR